MKAIKILILPDNPQFGQLISVALNNPMYTPKYNLEIHLFGSKNNRMSDLENYDIAFINEDFGGCRNAGLNLAKQLIADGSNLVRIAYADRAIPSQSHIENSTHVQSFFRRESGLYIKDFGYRTVVDVTENAIKVVVAQERLHESKELSSNPIKESEIQ